MMKFDLVVVTAANAAQAKGYKAQLKGRKNFLVLPDPGGRRVGSLGATVNALRKIKAGKSSRVLVCHSGGDARRTPGYAAMGKAFVPMRDSRPMLDHIIEEMEKLPSLPGVTVCCGDVIPYLDAAKVAFAEEGVSAVAYPDGPWQAQRHGVFEVEGKATGLKKVAGFKQKPQVKSGRHLIDTGIMHIDWATAGKMRSLPVAGDIYEEFPKLLLEGFAEFSVSVVSKCRFFHIGSSRELLEHLGSKGVLVDGTGGNELELAGGNIVTNVPAGYGKIKLGKNECLTALPLGKSDWYMLKYMLDDNFKADGLWEKHGLKEKMRKIDHARLLAVRASGAPAPAKRGVRVTAPVRIDFAGGWSDTPPICFERGGTVVNAAVILDGKRPIEVVVKARKDKFVKVVSRDLGKRKLIKSAAEIADHHDPHDWCCLAKSALAVTGFKFGDVGIDLVMSADLPKGSGMGTSSILGSATITALLAFAGEKDLSAGRVGELTLRLEQEMRTGGGWQDQFGGLVGGFKLLVSKPGKVQKVEVETIDAFPGSELKREFAERSLLYFTGQKRMARNILFKVLSFHAENPHGFAGILVEALKDGARKCASALAKGDFEGFASAVNGYWRDKKLLDPGSTNERVEAIIDSVKNHLSAVTLAGAGGGGFMYMFAKSAADARAIKRKLTKAPISKWSRFYDFAIDEKGISTETL
jgi:galactokinase/mevalonate kinase-like predicted kinase